MSVALVRTETCQTCRFLHRPNPDIAAGICHRNPPVPILLGLAPPKIQGQSPTAVTEGHWPQVGLVDWCGEWSASAGYYAGIDLSKVGQEGTA